MSKIVPPRDCLGNEIFKDSWISILFKVPPIFKVIAIENGGIHTANGITLASVRAICDMHLKQVPGVPFDSIIRIVMPNEQEAAERLAELLARRDPLAKT